MIVQPRRPHLQNAMNKAYSTLSTHEPGSPEYTKVLDQIVTLDKMQQLSQPAPVSHDTLVNAAVSLVGMFMIIRHEELNVITSRAFGLLKFR